jgi:hypothetical protein
MMICGISTSDVEARRGMRGTHEDDMIALLDSLRSNLRINRLSKCRLSELADFFDQFTDRSDLNTAFMSKGRGKRRGRRTAVLKNNLTSSSPCALPVSYMTVVIASSNKLDPPLLPITSVRSSIPPRGQTHPSRAFWYCHSAPAAARRSASALSWWREDWESLPRIPEELM